jgi:small-conductance mechanosensitive channel
MEVFGIRLVGMTAENGHKLLLTLGLILTVFLLTYGARAILSLLLRSHRHERVLFWSRQGISLFAAVLLLLGVLSIWFDDPTRLATAFGLVSAGLAFALQKVVTSIAGYFVILRGKNFTVGDRITMGGVRGDVITLSFIQTTIMEMGQPPAVQGADPAMWVRSRQFTGRIVTVANSQIFDEPVYNYTRDFPFIWEELTMPVTYKSDRGRAEQILLDAARRHALSREKLTREALDHMRRRYLVDVEDLEPRVFYRLTDNWLELTVRFLAKAYGVREVKDAMSREILTAFEEAGIGVASATFEVVGLPPLQVHNAEALSAGNNRTGAVASAREKDGGEH